MFNQFRQASVQGKRLSVLLGIATIHLVILFGVIFGVVPENDSSAKQHFVMYAFTVPSPLTETIASPETLPKSLARDRTSLSAPTLRALPMPLERLTYSIAGPSEQAIAEDSDSDSGNFDIMTDAEKQQVTNIITATISALPPDTCDFAIVELNVGYGAPSGFDRDNLHLLRASGCPEFDRRVIQDLRKVFVVEGYNPVTEPGGTTGPRLRATGRMTFKLKLP